MGEEDIMGHGREKEREGERERERIFLEKIGVSVVWFLSKVSGL